MVETEGGLEGEASQTVSVWAVRGMSGFGVPCPDCSGPLYKVPELTKGDFWWAFCAVLGCPKCNTWFWWTVNDRARKMKRGDIVAHVKKLRDHDYLERLVNEEHDSILPAWKDGRRNDARLHRIAEKWFDEMAEERMERK